MYIHITVLYTTVWYNTILYSTVQYSTQRHIHILKCLSTTLHSNNLFQLYNWAIMSLGRRISQGTYSRHIVSTHLCNQKATVQKSILPYKTECILSCYVLVYAVHMWCV